MVRPDVPRSILLGALLAVAAGCSDQGPPPVGSIVIATTTTGGDIDRDGYRIQLDSAPAESIGVHGALRLDTVRTGTHALVLHGVAANCTVSGDSSRTVLVELGAELRETFSVLCTTTGITVAMTTGGLDVDLDGYTVAVDSLPPVHVDPAGIVTITYLGAGHHTLTLGGLAPNCTPSPQNPVAVDLATGDVDPVALSVSCTATRGWLLVSAATTGLDVDADGYTVTIGSTVLGLGAGLQTVASLLPDGTYPVTLGGVAPNCSVAGGPTRNATVTSGRLLRDSTLVSFAVSCVAKTGDMEVRVATTGLDTALGNYRLRLDSLTVLPISGVGPLRVTGLPPGTHTLSLEQVPPNCTVAGVNPRPLTITAGGATRDTSRTGFAVSCVATTGVIDIGLTTQGFDYPSGFVVRVDDQLSLSLNVSPNDTASFSVPAGSHTVRLMGLPFNCTPGGANPATLTVNGGTTVRDTARVSFAVTCFATTGAVRVTATTTGVDLPPSPYQFTLVGFNVQRALTVPVNGSWIETKVTPGAYLVGLADYPVNCDTVGPASHGGVVSLADTTSFGFTMACQAAAQLAVTSTADNQLWTVKANGTGSVALTSMPSHQSEPAWSPDGSRLAFVSDRDGNFEIYVMDAGGTNLQRLTNHPARDVSPAWSPDGTRIAFVSERDGNAEVYVMGADGSNPVRLTNNPGADLDPAWSPDGMRIAYSSARGTAQSIYLMQADGSGATRLTGGTLSELMPAWSPDGSKIVFIRDWTCAYYGGCGGTLVVVPVNGFGETVLTGPGSEPAWSRDGKWVAFSSVTCWSYYYYYSYCDTQVSVVASDARRAEFVVSGAQQPAWRP